MMDSVTLTTVAANLFSMAIGAGGIYGAIVRPYQKKLDIATGALNRANTELSRIQDQQVYNRLNTHDKKIEELIKQGQEQQQKQHDELSRIGDKISAAFERAVTIDATGRRSIHERLDRLDRTTERLDERTDTTNKKIETMDERLAVVAEDVAGLAGKHRH